MFPTVTFLIFPFTCSTSSAVWSACHTLVTNAQCTPASLRFMMIISTLDIFLQASFVTVLPYRCLHLSVSAKHPPFRRRDSGRATFPSCSHESPSCSQRLAAAPPPAHPSLLRHALLWTPDAPSPTCFICSQCDPEALYFLARKRRIAISRLCVPSFCLWAQVCRIFPQRAT